MNKTLYVKDENGPIWDKARELTGDKLSSFIMDYLRQFVSAQQLKAQGLQRIVLRYSENGLPVAKAFNGQWLVRPDEPVTVPYDGSLDDVLGPGDHIPDRNFAVAITPKKNFVFFEYESEDDGEFSRASLSVYGSLEEANAASFSEESLPHIPPSVISEVMRRLGVAIQELDI